MSVVRERKRKMVDGLVKMHLDNFKASGAELILGSARFVEPRTLESRAFGRRHTGRSREEDGYRHRHTCGG